MVKEHVEQEFLLLCMNEEYEKENITLPKSPFFGHMTAAVKLGRDSWKYRWDRKGGMAAALFYMQSPYTGPPFIAEMRRRLEILSGDDEFEIARYAEQRELAERLWVKELIIRNQRLIEDEKKREEAERLAKEEQLRKKAEWEHRRPFVYGGCGLAALLLLWWLF